MVRITSSIRACGIVVRPPPRRDCLVSASDEVVDQQDGSCRTVDEFGESLHRLKNLALVYTPSVPFENRRIARYGGDQLAANSRRRRRPFLARPPSGRSRRTGHAGVATTRPPIGRRGWRSACSRRSVTGA